MDLRCQVESLEHLNNLKDADIHSVIIYGPQSCGKTYLAKRYSDMLSISDFYLVAPKVSELRETIEMCSKLSTSVVLCIENLDTGVFAASSALLKFLEEPTPNVYIVVTVRNLKQIQDTIISRSHVVGVSVPTKDDLSTFAQHKYPEEYRLYNGRSLWNCVQTFEDVEIFLKMDTTSIHYIEELPTTARKSSCVSDLVWSLQKYPENKGDTPIGLVIRYIVYKCPELLMDGIECIRNIEQKRIANYAIITKFAFSMRQKWGLIV